ncbi:hypothetical protein AgCh_002715 [Apium graveolens]
MATARNLHATSPSSSQPRWDVFLSFYGKDTRTNFVSHLYSALDQAGMLTFRDDPALQKGEKITPGLLNAIRDSKVFVVVVSENYARSPWCLNELVEILSCNTIENQVIPVFYYVDPSDDLRHLTGSFGEALDYHKKRYSVEMIDKWKAGLVEISEMSGYHLKNDQKTNESKTIQEIVDDVVRKTSRKVLYLEQHLVQIDFAVEEVFQKLSMKSNDVRAIGICGMGGIGKTTIAKVFYNTYSENFEISCFIECVKEFSQGGSPLFTLLQQILVELLRKKDYKVRDVESSIRHLKQILCSKKALVVLDDLDQLSYSEFLARFCDLFSGGSRIIITTRDVNLLEQLKSEIPEVEIYMVKKLGQTDSLKLFSYHAFGKSVAPESLRKLSESFATYAGGLPLALKVLGSSLRGRTNDVLFWKAKLEKLKKFPENG